MRLLLIVNPRSGTTGLKGHLADRVAARLRQGGHACSTVWTERPGHATEIAARAAAEGAVDAVAAMGGDGTVNETARGLIGTSMPLGIIPCGSGNGLARHIEIPVGDVARAADIVVLGHAEAVDVAMADGRLCACTCGVGFDAATAHRFAQATGRGLLTYVRSAVEEYHRRQSARYRLTLDGSDVAESAIIVAVCNASQWGNNAYIAPGASIKDGLLDVVVVRPAKTGANVLTAVEVMSGRLRASGRVALYRARDVVVSRLDSLEPTMLGHIDGEPVTLPSRLTVRCMPGALRLLTPLRHRGVRPWRII